MCLTAAFAAPGDMPNRIGPKPGIIVVFHNHSTFLAHVQHDLLMCVKPTYLVQNQLFRPVMAPFFSSNYRQYKKDTGALCFATDSSSQGVKQAV